MSAENLTKNQDISEKFCQEPEVLTGLLYIENFGRFCFYEQAKGYYKALSHFDIEKKIRDFLKAKVNKGFTMSTVKDVSLQVKFDCLKRWPTYLSEYVSFTDQLLNTKTLELEAFDPQKFSFVSVPLHSDTWKAIITNPTRNTLENAPNFQKFLNYILVKEDMTTDTELTAVMQEVFGYCLLPTVAAEATFFFVGDGANGKSKLLDVLKYLVGYENFSAQTIENITTNNFALSSLVGKRLNICTEESSDYMKQDKFKALISGEPVTIEAKFQDSYTDSLPVKFLFATNEMPSFSGFNHAFTRRLKIIPFLRKITEEEKDPRIVEKMLPELPYIFEWAMRGAYRLLTNSLQFSASESMRIRSIALEENLSSAIMFLREKYEVDETAFISNDDLWTDYKVWAPYVGKKTMGQDRFFKDIARSFNNAESLRDRVEGQQKRGRPLRLRKDQ